MIDPQFKEKERGHYTDDIGGPISQANRDVTGM
jgi:hypothetical protein